MNQIVAFVVSYSERNNLALISQLIFLTATLPQTFDSELEFPLSKVEFLATKLSFICVSDTELFTSFVPSIELSASDEVSEISLDPSNNAEPLTTHVKLRFLGVDNFVVVAAFQVMFQAMVELNVFVQLIV